MIILHTPHSKLLHFETPCVVYSPNLNEVNVCFNVFWLSIAFNNFCCVEYGISAFIITPKSTLIPRVSFDPIRVLCMG